MSTASADPAALARDLLRCPSVTPAEAGALGVIEGALKAAGFTLHRVTFAEPGTAPVENLYARIGSASPHFAFAGHVDVVPPGEQAKWTHPPFAGEIADGTLYGRGAVDMKGAIASALAATLDHLAAHGGRPNGSISFLITGDEEGIAVNGTVKLLQWAAERGENFDHCILGEPSNATRIGDTSQPSTTASSGLGAPRTAQSTGNAASAMSAPSRRGAMNARWRAAVRASARADGCTSESM